MALTFKFRADGSGYKRGLDKMRDQTKSWAGGIKGMIAGAFGMAMVIASFRRLGEKFDRIHKLSKRFELDAKSIQKLGFAAEQNGTSMEMMAKAMAQGNRSAQEAANGLKTYQRAFDALNINVQQFAQLNQEQQMYAIADAVSSATDSNKAMAAAQQILGRSALELMPLLKQGSEAIREQAESIKTLSNEQVAAIAKTRDTINRVKTDVSGIFGSLIANIAIGVKAIAAFITQIAVEVSDMALHMATAMNKAMKLDVEGAKRSLDTVAKIYEGAAGRIEKAWKGAGDGFVGSSGSGGGGAGGDGSNPATVAAEKRLEIEKKIAAEIEKQADATRTLEEKAAAAKKEWEALQDQEFEAVRKAEATGATEEDKTAASEAQLKQEEAYTKWKQKQRDLVKQQAAEEESKRDAARQADEAYMEMRKREEEEAEAEKFRRAEEMVEEEKEAERIQTARENAISTSSLASIGGGGNVSAFTADPALSESKRQTGILEEISAKLEPAGGVEGTPEL